MKRILTLLLFTTVLLTAQQPFTFSFSASTYYAQQGLNKESQFPVNVQTATGFNASIYLTLTVSDVVNKTIIMTHSVLNYPNYANTLKISLPYTFTIPKGNYKIKLKGENTGVSWTDSCMLTIKADSCPSWFKYNDINSPLQGDAVDQSMFDTNNNIWICNQKFNTQNYTIAKFDFNKWYVWTTTGLKVYDDERNYLYTDSSQKISAAYYFPKIKYQSTTVYVLSTANLYSIYNNQITDITLPENSSKWSTFTFDNNNSFVIATNNHVYRRTGTAWSAINLFTPPFSPDFTAVEFDNDNNLWVSTGQKIFRLSGQFWTTFDSNSGIGVSDKVFRDRQGNIWCNGSAGIFKFNKVSGSFENVINISGTADLCFDHNNNPVISKNDYSINVFKNNTLSVLAKYDPSHIFGPYGFPHHVDISPSGNLLLSAGYNGCIAYCNSNNLPVTIAEEGVQKEQITIFPNPASSMLCINGVVSGSVLHIYLADGTLLRKEIIRESNNCIDVSGLKSGLYLAVIHDAKNTRTVKKIMIE